MVDELFNGQPVAKFFEQQVKKAQERVSDMTAEDVADPEAALSSVMSAATTDVPRLIRQKTTFSTDEVGGRIHVSAWVPFEGDQVFFHVSPANRPTLVTDLDALTPNMPVRGSQRPRAELPSRWAREGQSTRTH